MTNEFPCTISHNGMDYSSTGKTGTNIKTGKHVAEMEAGFGLPLMAPCLPSN